MHMLIHWIWFATRTGMGDKMKCTLLSHFEDPEEVYFAPELEFERFEDLSPSAVESIMDKDLTACEEILESCQQKGIHILTYRDAAYPARLKNIPDPPMVLYYKGRLPAFDELPVIGVVGTRRASAYGLTAAKRLGYQIAACGGTVVSGMATGIDGTAMKGALTAGGTVVGILGCGADIVYPASNRWLYADTEKYGCILSEFPPGTPPVGRNFPRRNRIISGLSCGVLVVEAPEKSGALITARLSADQGRDVFVVPANIDVESAMGSNALMREGAIPVSSGWDILSEYRYQFPSKVRQNRTPVRMTATAEELSVEREEPAKVAQEPKKSPEKKPKLSLLRKKVIDNSEKSAYIDFKKTHSALSADEQRIVSALENGQRLVDDVIAELELAPGVILASLTMLEIKGIVRRLPGRYIELPGNKH